MLDELSVKNFGIIEEISWKPSPGLNVITGETGAGKSLVVDAVEALLSGQAREEDIRHGSAEARVEGIFHRDEREGSKALGELLAEKGLDADDGTILLACEFRRQGRTTPRVNRQAVSRALLKDIGGAMVDIHGQSEHLSLLNKSHHLEYLDAYAHTLEKRHAFAAKVVELHQMDREIQSLTKDERELARQTELLNFQIDEIKRAEIEEGEEEALQKELTILTSAEKLKTAAFEIYRIIYGDESAMAAASALDRVNEALPLMKQIVDTDSSMQSKMGSLVGIINGLEELAREIRSYGDNLNFDPQRLEEVQNRLELLKNLKRKYGGSIKEVLDYLAKAEKELAGLAFSGERRQELEVRREQLKKEMGALASKLSQERQRAGKQLAVVVKKELGELSMGRVEFIVSITQEISPEGIPFPDGKYYKFDNKGVDNVAFLASTNPGEPAKALDRIASTGEISRFMLALKSALAEADTIPVLIFDEIDIGIGGRSGEVIGRKLWKLAQHHQVICVTHLPQIAAFADTQYRVSKKTDRDRTVSTIESLEGEARFKELAVMIGGPRYTENALKAARELIEGAEGWKSAEPKG
ncbi:MAG: DNA repair protein RecN [Chloroflexi bacterium RBG_13_51_18]|nr:MAG: DNA repair protein RecN [Chloroflexi bacterium RBG_13_51_18]